MKLSERRMSVGFGFAAGALFGALAVFVPLGIPLLKAEGSAPGRPLGVETARRGDVSETPTASLMREADSGRAAPVLSGKNKPRSPRAQQKKVPRHSELDLQLD